MILSWLNRGGTVIAAWLPGFGTGLEITRVGLGACAIGGGGWEFGWARKNTRSRSRRSTGLWS